MKEFHAWNLVFDPVLPAREVAVAYLNECGFSMFEPHERGVLAHGEAGEVDEEAAEACLNEIRAFAEVVCDKRLVAQENWNAQWEAEYPQVVVKGKQGETVCTIRAPFHDSPAEGLDVVVAPQMSFGTGHHATTYLMTHALLALDLVGKPVMDMGCGTGVLALVAGLKGASPVRGIDIERDAVQNSEHNVALNPRLQGCDIQFTQGDGSSLDLDGKEEWAVLCANIHKNVLMSDMHRYARALKEGGSLLLSGFFEGDVPSLQTAAEEAGLQVLEVHVREGWACIHCGKPLA